jgi:hypothetical protein
MDDREPLPPDPDPLDEAVEDTFPPSDPPSETIPAE